MKTVLIYGSNNEMDLVVLEVLLKKARTIREQLGIAVPVPVGSEQVVNALVDSVLLRRRGQERQLALALEDASVSRLHEAWDQLAEKEQKTRAFFAQHQIKPDDLALELKEMEPVLGSADDVNRFMVNAMQRFNGEVRPTKNNNVFELNPGELRDRIIAREGKLRFPLSVTFNGIATPGASLLGRNHPSVSTAAEGVLAKALEGDDSRFSRSSAIFTGAVNRRTAVLVLRLRYLITQDTEQFAEEIVTAAFQRDGAQIRWLKPVQEESLKLLGEGDAQVSGNMPRTERQEQIEWALNMLDNDWYKEILEDRANALKTAHNRLSRTLRSRPATVKPYEPPDIIGCYVLVPGGR